MNKFVVYALSATLIFGAQSSVYQAYGAENKSTQSSDSVEEEPPSMRKEIAKIQNGNWINITLEQKLEDIDYLHKTLQENYPYFNVVKRMIGIDLEEAYQKTRSDVANTTSDIAFYQLLEQYVNSVQQLGHLMIFNPYSYLETASGYKEIAEAYPENEYIAKIAEAYNNKKSLENYKKMEIIIKPAYDKVMAYYDVLEKENTTKEQTQNQTSENIETKIIEESKIAYIKINSFPSDNVYEADKKILFDFYSKVKNYENVIFDFTENGGGAMSYFNDLIVAPNTDKTLKANVYTLIKDGDYNKKFLDIADFKTLETFPKLPRMNQEDLSDLGYYNSDAYEINPLQQEKILKGKLWMLVSKNVFSSSEYAAMFSKATGFMTLVGTETGGDGIGSDPLPIVLPNSGLIVRYAPVYGVTPDGASSQEFGTMPDFVSPEGETALDTCLKAISSQKDK